jgi:glyoxylase-like metal-dependent hydrolase (beta-lactamase superfamily II)
MIIRALPVGPLQANCYIVGCETKREAVVIDPGGDADRILMALAKEKLKVVAIVDTHGHFDHVGGNRALKEATGAPLMIHRLDLPMLAHAAASAASWGLKADNSSQPDRLLEEGDTIACGEITLKVLHTPGHTPGGISLYTPGAVFVGDTLFADSIGRTDFPGGNFETLIEAIRSKLFALPPDTVVYAGHMQTTTIGREKQYNPFCGDNA